jgi:hypothetical protein
LPLSSSVGPSNMLLAMYDGSAVEPKNERVES